MLRNTLSRASHVLRTTPAAHSLRCASSPLVSSSLSSSSTSSSSSPLAAQVQVRAYHKRVVEHFENPRNVGSLNAKDPDVGTGLVGAPACGDVMKLQFRVNDEGVIEEAKFKTFGCGSAIASSSYATTWLEGKTIDEAARIKNKDISDHLNLPPVKIHCSMLAEDAIKAAIQDLQAKQQKTQAESA
jgi:Fe-S cluster assembly scaffold IscU